MAFNQGNFQPAGGQVEVPGFIHPCGLLTKGIARGTNSPASYAYKTEDSSVTVEASGYFNDIGPDAKEGNYTPSAKVDRTIPALHLGDTIAVVYVTDIDLDSEALVSYSFYVVTSTALNAVAITDAITDFGTYYQPGGPDVAVADGGTGASTAADARTNLGIDYFSGGTDVAVADGGTGASTTVDARVNLAQDFPVGTFATATPRDIILEDAWTTIVMNLAGANNIVIPANSNIAFPIGTELIIMQYGAGTTTVQISTDDLRYDAAYSAALNGQYAVVGIKKVAATEWFLFGNLAVAP